VPPPPVPAGSAALPPVDLAPPVNDEPPSGGEPDAPARLELPPRPAEPPLAPFAPPFPWSAAPEPLELEPAPPGELVKSSPAKRLQATIAAPPTSATSVGEPSRPLKPLLLDSSESGIAFRLYGQSPNRGLYEIAGRRRILSCIARTRRYRRRAQRLRGEAHHPELEQLPVQRFEEGIPKVVGGDRVSERKIRDGHSHRH
jgi:hypothetical protein